MDSPRAEGKQDIAEIGNPRKETNGKTDERARRPSQFTRFAVVDLEGVLHRMSPTDFAESAVFQSPEPVYALLRHFVGNDLGLRPSCDSAPRHIAIMRAQELVDYCSASEKGHLKWYPKGVLIQKLLLDYASRLAHEWGAFEMKNPLLIRGGCNEVGQLMGEFHERDYKVDGGRGIGYLRYASDPLAFPFMQDVRFTLKQTPLKVYEEASCFRNEQEGEVSGLRRVRNFLMTDMHAACASVDQAREEFETLCFRFARLMNDVIAGGRWVLGWESTEEFFEANRDWLIGIGKRIGVPAFFKLMPKMSHYYAMKNEFQAIAGDGFNIQVGTVQWDVKDGERFGIGPIDGEGVRHPCPVIIHASSFGSIERTLCAILENIASESDRGVPPAFPFWLSPTQARVIPVSDAYVDFALEMCDRISRGRLRCDVDDREETVGKKIRNAEKEWIPFQIVVGEKEERTGRICVRERGGADQRESTVEDFLERVLQLQADMPFRPLPLPVRVSQRPLFH